VLIDVGLNDSEARETWKKAFAYLSIDPTEITTIYLTHFHPDHTGLAGWMQELTGARVYMHDIDARMLERVWGKDSVQTAHMKEMVLNHGVPEQLSEEIITQMDKLNSSVLPLPKVDIIGSEVQFADLVWKVIHTPGHSSGHICFLQEEEQILIVGDTVLEKITPNISVWPGASQKPLHEYIDSLQKLKLLPVKIAYSAHYSPIIKFKQRIEELILHHEERLNKIEKLAENKTAYEIAEILFSHKFLNPHQWRFAIAETIAHLNYLEQEMRIEHEGSRPIIYKRHVNV
jgi:glyoxylase-like metal-dependent hydrolase (beta-lactamase superfamily II)